MGDSERALSRGASAGDLARVRRGSYLDSVAWRGLSLEDQHFIKMIATAAAAVRSPVFSHESAAVAWRFPIVEGLPSRTQITVPPGSGLRSDRLVVRHEAPLDCLDVIDAESIRLTSPSRTLVDFMATRSFLSAVCGAEGALRSGLVVPEHVEEAIARRRPFRGSRRAEAVARFASGLSASPNESLCRVRFHQLGFPQPTQQKEYPGLRGGHLEVDFYFDEFDVICETDGRVKYEDERYLAGRTPQQALWEEKEREDHLRSMCRDFVRLTWNDAWHRTGLIAKLARAGIPRRP
ncbi:MAG: hypothetical protein R2717_00860 [Schumannella sp.]